MSLICATVLEASTGAILSRTSELAAREAKPTLAIGMGFPGVATRLLGGRAGAPWTYAAAAEAAAPGQLPLARLAQLLRGRRPSRATKALGVIGKPVGHSRSPAL